MEVGWSKTRNQQRRNQRKSVFFLGINAECFTSDVERRTAGVVQHDTNIADREKINEKINQS